MTMVGGLLAAGGVDRERLFRPGTMEEGDALVVVDLVHVKHVGEALPS